MNDDTIKVCDKTMKEAIDSGDQTRIWHAFAISFAAMMDCQKKTRGTQKEMNKEMLILRTDMLSVKADVKELNLEHKEIGNLRHDMDDAKDDISEMKESHKEFQALKERGKGAAWMGRIALIAGGGVVYDIALRIIEHFSK